MKLWSALSIDLIKNAKVSDAYRLFVISLTTNKDNISHISLSQLSSYCGDTINAYKVRKNTKKDGSDATIPCFTKRVNKLPDIQVKTIWVSKEKGSEKSESVYFFAKPKQYRRVKREFMDLNLSNRLKGVLLKLFCFTNKCSNIVALSVDELAKEFDTHKRTITRYLDELESQHLIKRENGLIYLTVDSFIIDGQKSFEELTKYFDDLLDSYNRLPEWKKGVMPKELCLYKHLKETNYEEVTDKVAVLCSLQSGMAFIKEQRKEAAEKATAAKKEMKDKMAKKVMEETHNQLAI